MKDVVVRQLVEPPICTSSNDWATRHQAFLHERCRMLPKALVSFFQPSLKMVSSCQHRSMAASGRVAAQGQGVRGSPGLTRVLTI